MAGSRARNRVTEGKGWIAFESSDFTVDHDSFALLPTEGTVIFIGCNTTGIVLDEGVEAFFLSCKLDADMLIRFPRQIFMGFALSEKNLSGKKLQNFHGCIDPTQFYQFCKDQGVGELTGFRAMADIVGPLDCFRGLTAIGATFIHCRFPRDCREMDLSGSVLEDCAIKRTDANRSKWNDVRIRDKLTIEDVNLNGADFTGVSVEISDLWPDEESDTGFRIHCPKPVTLKDVKLIDVVGLTTETFHYCCFSKVSFYDVETLKTEHRESIVNFLANQLARDKHKPLADKFFAVWQSSAADPLNYLLSRLYTRCYKPLSEEPEFTILPDTMRVTPRLCFATMSAVRALPKTYFSLAAAFSPGFGLGRGMELVSAHATRMKALDDNASAPP